jgi:malonyl-CoA decarboxylase
VVDRDFAHLFASWFNRGFLVLRPIDWTTPVNILERIIRYEAVHAIENWDDLRNRLKPPDRRCFAFFHPQLVDEPLIFVEIALTTDIPSAVAPLLHPAQASIRPQDATTAVFYSISSTQKGLSGISFGNFLIKQVVTELQSELPHLNTFITLSPIPGFSAWLTKERQAARLEPTELSALSTLDSPLWHEDPASHTLLRDVLIRLGARYLMDSRNASGLPLDPVARFHLGNGARLERLNFLADMSPRGLEQSHSLMVNYCYALPEIERNHDSFAENGTVAASPTIHKQRRIEVESRNLAPV